MSKRNKVLSIVFISVAFFVMVSCFYKTSFNYDVGYISDLPVHIRISQLIFNPEFYTQNYFPHIEGYLLFHITIKGVGYVFLSQNYEAAAALVLAMANLFTLGIMMFIFGREYQGKLNGIVVLMIIGMIFVIGLPLTGACYLPQGSPNVWHNPTVTFSRPFALLSFWSFYRIITSAGKSNLKLFLLFSITSLLCCYAKPSFSLVFLPIAGTWTLYVIMKSKFKEIRLGCLLFLAVLPTLLLMLYQYSLAFQDNLTMVIQFGTFLNLSLIESVVATLSLFLFPLIYLGLYRGKIVHKTLLGLAFAVAIFGWVQYFFLGTLEVAYGDFMWGYSIAIFILYAVVLFDLYAQARTQKYWIIVALYGVQVVFGVYFFSMQWMLRGFWI